MNSKSILLAATLAGGLLSAAVAASASVVVDVTARSETATFSAPVPVKIVSPIGIARRYQGETIRLGLTVDAAGQPRNLSLLSSCDPHLVRHLLPVVARWQFAPAKKNGRAVPADIVLPIQLVDGPAS